MENSGEHETEDQRIDSEAARDATPRTLLKSIRGAEETRRRRATKRVLP
jgi:hypothetical protein